MTSRHLPPLPENAGEGPSGFPLPDGEPGRWIKVDPDRLAVGDHLDGYGPVTEVSVIRRVEDDALTGYSVTTAGQRFWVSPDNPPIWVYRRQVLLSDPTALAEFLIDRYAEREEVIRGWDATGQARVAGGWVGGHRYVTVAGGHTGDGDWVADGHFIAFDAPPTVLWDSQEELATLRVLRALAATGTIGVLQILARPYTGHPAFRSEWAA